MCEQCGAPHWHGPKFCSRLCSRRAHNSTPQAQAFKQSRKRQRRAALRNVERVRYIDTDIYERDRWCCQLCGLPIDRGAKYPDPMSRSIDHVVPISLGGGDTPTNVQAAHLTCNLRKHDRYDGFQQMALEVA
jgi:5-methylcytosine-specific restriction endonuclease McrA